MLIGQYEAEFCPDHPKANSDGYVHKHVLVAEQILGRYLRQGETVHHKNCNKLDNSSENLMVFKTKADHTRFHRYDLDRSLLEEIESLVWICHQREHYCPLCGSLMPRGKYKSCIKCKGIQSRLVERPPREEFKILVRNNSFEAIGKKYGLSGKAITKWCIGYNLPSKRKDIRQYSDKEWETL